MPTDPVIVMTKVQAERDHARENLHEEFHYRRGDSGAYLPRMENCPTCQSRGWS